MFSGAEGLEFPQNWISGAEGLKFPENCLSGAEGFVLNLRGNLAFSEILIFSIKPMTSTGNLNSLSTPCCNDPKLHLIDVNSQIINNIRRFSLQQHMSIAKSS